MQPFIPTNQILIRIATSCDSKIVHPRALRVAEPRGLSSLLNFEHASVNCAHTRLTPNLSNVFDLEHELLHKFAAVIFLPLAKSLIRPGGAQPGIWDAAQAVPDLA